MSTLTPFSGRSADQVKQDVKEEKARFERRDRIEQARRSYKASLFQSLVSH